MKKYIRFLASWMAAVMLLACLTACGNTAPNASTQQSEPNSSAPSSGEENYDGQLILESTMQLDYAKNFSIDFYKGGYRMITAGTGGFKYLVVPENMSVPQDLDENVKVLQQPINSVYIASSGMASLISAIGALDRVKLVATEQNEWYIDDIAQAMANGEIAYSGNYKEPDYELMTANGIQLHVDTTMIDGYPEVLEKFEELGIPSLVEDSSRESHPLGRVEWVKIFGALFGMEDEAEQYFEEQKELVAQASTDAKGDVTVAMGYITSNGKCYARNGGDYLAQMIELAGGTYNLADMNPNKSGNSNMTFEEWYAINKDADYLFYLNYLPIFSTIEEMIEYNPLFADFKCVQNGNVWITSEDFTQSTAAVASIISDMSEIISSGDGNVTTDHLIKLK